MEIIKEKLSNGLSVILAPISGSKAICEMFMVRAGWKYEWPEIYGLSHLIEHMMFGGTERRPSEDKIAEEIEGRGGVIDAGTGDEDTVYWVEISGRFIDVASDILSDMVLNSKFDPSVIEVEKKEILEEISMRLDDPMSYLHDIHWLKLLYRDQPAAQMGLGTKETLTSLRREQLLAYLGGLYVAPNARVLVTGQIENPQKLIGDLEICYGRLSSKEPFIHKVPVIEKQEKIGISFEYREIKQTNVYLGVRGYSIFHPDRHVLKILENILGDGMSSRMLVELRTKRGIAYNISSIVDFQTDTGSFVTYAGFNSERILEAIEAMMEQYRKVREQKIAEEELERAKNSIIGSRERKSGHSADVARFLSEQFLLGDQIVTLEEWAEKIKAITADDIQRVAQDIFQDNKLNLAIIGPHPDPRFEEKLYPILKF